MVQIRDQSTVTTEVIQETRAWLREHPDDAGVRAALLALVRAVPGGPVGEVIQETRAWLADHPDDAGVRAALLSPAFSTKEALLTAHPGDQQVELSWFLPENAAGVEIQRDEPDTEAKPIQLLPAEPNGDRLVDRNVRNGVRYRYTLRVMFADPTPGRAGSVLRSTGTVCEVIPTALPEPAARRPEGGQRRAPDARHRRRGS
jgi:hypothetical protein